MPNHNDKSGLQLARFVCAVPHLYESGNKSTTSLLREAGVIEARQALSVELVAQVLSTHAELMRLWLGRGADQRICGGWGIECECDGQSYRLVNFANGHTVHYSDAAKATAEFLVRYVAFICDKSARN